MTRPWLKQLREKRGLTQKALARRVGDGVSLTAIQKWEAGDRTPSRATQFALARLLGTKVLHLFDAEAAAEAAAEDIPQERAS